MTPEQKVKAATRVELEKLLAADQDHKAQLSFEELTTVSLCRGCGESIKYVRKGFGFWDPLSAAKLFR